MQDADDFAGLTSSPGPLFEWAEGPFARSRVRPSPVEALVAGLIWRHCGRRNPISIAEIRRLTASAAPPQGLSERKIKEIVEDLRIIHRAAIGSKRDDPPGYFRIMDAEDREATLAAYRSQVVRMFQVLRALDEPARLRELLGQLRLEEEG